MDQTVDINIYGSTIRVQSKQASTLKMLEIEFKYFLTPSISKPDFIITLHHTSAPSGIIPRIPANKISQNSLTYDDGAVRWNDYFGKALSIYDYRKNEGIIYSNDSDLIHEIAYLMILSLTGKDLDSRGFHKVHACSFRYRSQDVIVMLPSKGGKTTLFLEIAKLPGVSLISDDTPLIDSNGRVHPFPLRLGVDHLPSELEEKKSQFSLFKRQQFTDKWLIPLDQLPSPIAENTPSSKAILILAQRWSSPESHLSTMDALRTFRALSEHMVIGIGLPMILEYFIRSTPSDWLKLFSIALKRVWSAIRLWQNSSHYLFTMGTSPKQNALSLLQFLEKK
ncbi:MAG: hypothetical protein K2P81_13585 [Bacteriovoracaceae bacterium]|nr:hypothetical protein [Bacteriovoracaceae bacterium]